MKNVHMLDGVKQHHHALKTEKESSSISKVVGLIANVDLSVDPKKYRPTWLYRAVTMHYELLKHGVDLFVYSPGDVNTETKQAEGYVINQGEFVQKTLALPPHNYYWHVGKRKGAPLHEMKNIDFVKWCEQGGVNVYPPIKLSTIVHDKFKTFELVKEFSDSIHPYTELFENEEQLRVFLKKGTVFLKPRFGSMGDGIIVVLKEGSSYRVNHYLKKKRSGYALKTLPEVNEKLSEIMAGKRYIIQEGVDAGRFNGSAFDVRVIMLNDGQDWHWLHEVRLGVKGSDLSNMSQGGYNCPTFDVLSVVYGAEKVPEIVKRLRYQSIGLTEFIAKQYPGEIIEIAFDFVMDVEAVPKLAEINFAPGALGGPHCYKDFFRRTLQEELFYQQYTVVQCALLSKFLVNVQKLPKS